VLKGNIKSVKQKMDNLVKKLGFHKPVNEMSISVSCFSESRFRSVNITGCLEKVPPLAAMSDI